MTLIFTPSTLTKYYQNGAYNATAAVDLSETPFASVPSSLIAWLETQLLEGESLDQVVFESSGQVPVDVENEIPVTFRDQLNAAISVTAPQGSRTFTLSSEELPIDLRDGLLAAWNYIAGSHERPF
jgi:hypothetical protein